MSTAGTASVTKIFGMTVEVCNVAGVGIISSSVHVWLLYSSIFMVQYSLNPKPQDPTLVTKAHSTTFQVLI